MSAETELRACGYGAILSVEQAAELLGVRPKTVRALAAGGIIPAAKVGKPWRFDEMQLRDWLRAKAAENVKAPRTSLIPSSFGNVHSIKPGADSLNARLDRMLAEPAPPPSEKRRLRQRGNA